MRPSLASLRNLLPRSQPCLPNAGCTIMRFTFIPTAHENSIMAIVNSKGYAALELACWLGLTGPVGLCQERPSKHTNTPPPPAVTLTSAAGEVVHPVKVSENGRYFVDQRGNAVFWLGTTQWELFRGYTLDDAKLILEMTKAKGFAFAQVMLLGVGDGTKPNIYGEKPWTDNNPLTPNEAYFKNVDAVVRIARENNVAISMTLFHQRYGKYITVQNAHAWARWVARRYKEQPNIVWSTTPEAKPEFVPILRELCAAYVKEVGAGI